MGRKFIDCRDFPDSHCTVKLSADNDDELIEAAVEHATRKHGHQDSPELRRQLRELAKEERWT